MFTYEYEHPKNSFELCPKIFEQFGVKLEDRHKPASCPNCGVDCRRIISRVNFNEIFPGSTKRETLADHWTKESIKAQSEGFRSRDELDTAIGMAKDRAKQMGTPDKQLIGPVDSPYTGTKYTPTKDEVATADSLVRANLKAKMDGNASRIEGTQRDLKAHETTIRQKVTSSQKFEPKHSKPELQKQIKSSQEARKGK